MREGLISVETAKLAKEKGFDIDEDDLTTRENENTKNYYRVFAHPRGTNEKIDRGVEVYSVIEAHNIYCSDVTNHKVCSAPTQSLLQKWLREEHKMIVIPDYNVNEKLYFTWIIKKGKTSSVSKEFLNTYELALEKGLFEALKLIKE